MLSRIRSFLEQAAPGLIGYMRVSKADGSQTLDLQRDALLTAGVKPGRLYEDHASGKRGGRPGLTQGWLAFAKIEKSAHCQS
jgi:DNA invertase Pin-like site-specific DNA recombinase